MMYNAKEFGKRLRDCRIAEGLTQEQLSQRLNITANYEAKLETGIRTPSLELCGRIANTFRVSLDYLLLGETNQAERVKTVLRAAVKELKKLEKQL